ncbi:hypothetical protein R1flu_028472 [Riccia fluitans]|uniref:Uncharacterized protein n=1 Tax=Riccia fluitans TaxID=41844 RepID=A0ABD1XM86_9MARC
MSKRRRCSVLDSALGIMGFDSLKVYKTEGKFLVDMLTSVIHVKSSCGTISNYLGRMDGPNSSMGSQKCRSDQRLPVGTLLQIVNACKAFLASGKGDDTQVQEVVVALAKVAVESCSFSPRVESISCIYNREVYEKDGERRKDHKWAIQSVIDFAFQENCSIYSKLRPFGRLQFWRIRPSCLKQDISALASEAVLRLLLPLDSDLLQREEWATMIISLSLGVSFI